MRRCFSFLVLLLAILVMTATELRAERRVALVVGNAAYQMVPRLANPVNDANAVSALLRKAGFDVVEARNDLGSLDLKRAVRDFTNVARDADIALMYFAGHGIEIGGINYLIPVDARLASDFDAEDEALSLDRAVRALEPAKRLRLVILDACRDNPFLKTIKRTVATRAVSAGLAKVEPATTDTLIAFAAKAGSTAADGSGAHSPFTSALLKHIAVPGLDVRIAFGRVRDEVMRSTSNAQEPFVYGSLGGSTVALVPEPKRETAAATPPAPAAPTSVNPAADVRRDYELAERVGTKEAWESFLAVHTKGFYADLARSQLTKLAAAPPPQTDRGPSVAPATPAQAAQPEAPRQPVAALSPGAPAEPAAPALPVGELARQLQAELKRVGCDPGAVDGDWGAKSREALGGFNRSAGTNLDVKVASVEALAAVRAKSGRVCPLVCGPGFRIEGEACVAEPKAKPARREALEGPPPRRPAAPHRPGPISPGCQSPITVGGRQCCTIDTPGLAPRIVCQ